MASVQNEPENSGVEQRRRDTEYWAKPIARIDLSEVPDGAVSLNVKGRRVVGPVQGFGQMWQKTYRVRLEGSPASPEEVVKVWKQKLPAYQPPANRFFPSVAGVAPGEVVLINATLKGMPVSTGVLVLYADDESFTLMTPEGHPEAGWITFSAFQEDGTTVAQVQSMARANDPIFEFGFRFMGGSREQEKIWTHLLKALAADFGVEGEVHLNKVCVDGSLQWSQAKNVWHNAAVRSMLYTMAAPVRAISGRGRAKQPTENGK